ncbi:MAG: hypothetical protein ACXWMW_11965, partial [Syntrophales bacterium]
MNSMASMYRKGLPGPAAQTMLRRLATALLLLVLIVPAIVLGGVVYFLYVSFFIVTASLEYVQMFRAARFRPSAV